MRELFGTTLPLGVSEMDAKRPYNNPQTTDEQFECDDEADGFGLTPVPPIPLQAVLLTGEVSADGLTPTVGPTPFRLRARWASVE